MTMNTNLEKLVKDSLGTISMYANSRTMIWVGYSGGKDSTVVAHLASQISGFSGVCHVRTHTGPLSEQHSNKVRDMAYEHGWEYIEDSSFIRYEGLIAQYGFPGPGAHSLMYQQLKGRAFTKLIPRLRTAKRKRVLLLTGIRRAESQKRAQAPLATHVSKNEVWLSPILEWGDQDVRDYVDHFQLQVPHWDVSRDCLCGAYATEDERELIRFEHPDQFEYIEALEGVATAARNAQEVLHKYGGPRPFGLKFCRWGHGKNGASVDVEEGKRPMICNDCDGQLSSDGSGNVGIDMDTVLKLHKIKVREINDALGAVNT